MRWYFKVGSGIVCAIVTRLAIAQPQTIGQWETQMNWGLRGMHSILLRNGTVLCMSDPQYPDDCEPYPCPENNNIGIFDPVSNTINLNVPQMPRIGTPAVQWDLHCSGHVELADGRVLICAGGPDPDSSVMNFVYDPTQSLQSWQSRQVDDLPRRYPGTSGDPIPRWYPTCTALANGKVLIGGGRGLLCDWPGPTQEANRMITFDMSQAAGNQFQYVETGSIGRDLVWYAFMFLLKSGDVALLGGDEFGVQSCPNDRQVAYFKTSLGAWTTGPLYSHFGTSAAMYRPDAIVKISGGNHSGGGSECAGAPARAAWKIDLGQSSPLWTIMPCMASQRTHGGQLVVMPDGNVLAVGGAGRTPEMIDPDSQASSWTQLAQYTTARDYHSSAVLLPDARVLLAGGENPEPITTAQTFKPPYLFDAAGNPIAAQRPVIINPSLNSEFKYGDGTSISLGGNYADEIEQVVLMRPGAATHGYDQDQRRVPLEFLITGANTLKAAAPAHGNIAPPGYYMLFVMREGDRSGILFPSVATWVKLK